ALVATGRARNGYYAYEFAPPAALMYRLKYDCWAEAYAHAHVRSCSGRVSNPWQRPGWKENIHVLRTTATDELGAIQNAIARWQSELALYGVPSNVIYQYWMRDARRRIVRHMTKICIQNIVIQLTLPYKWSDYFDKTSALIEVKALTTGLIDCLHDLLEGAAAHVKIGTNVDQWRMENAIPPARLRYHEYFKSHAANFAIVLNLVITNLQDNFEHTCEALQTLGYQHVALKARGFQSMYWDIFTDCFERNRPATFRKEVEREVDYRKGRKSNSVDFAIIMT
ncbi:hypothetical protein TELCIR_07555, partial [Teladorsagia circumcincta]